MGCHGQVLGNAEAPFRPVFWLLMLLLAFLYLLPGFNHLLDIYDEGICVYGASRVLDGEVPYRDFWSFYAPAQFYTLAAIFKVFGASVVAARIFSLITGAALSLVLFLFAQKMLSPRRALLAWFLVLVWIGSYRLLASPLLPSLLFGFASALCLLHSLPKGSTSWLLLSGALAGVAACYRHDTGFYVMLSEGLVLILLAFVSRYAQEDHCTARWPRLRRRPLVAYIAGFLGVTVPVLAYFLAVAPLDELVRSFILFPLRTYPAVRGFPYPLPLPNPQHLLDGSLTIAEYGKSAALRLPFYIVLVVYMATLVRLGTRWRASGFHQQQTHMVGVILLAMLGIAFMSYARVRPDHQHLMPTATTASVLLAVLLWDMRSLSRHRLLGTVVVAVLGLANACYPFLARINQMRKAVWQPPPVLVDVERARGLRVYPPTSEYLDLVRYVRRNVSQNDFLFVGNARHDLIYKNDITLYFLCDRRSATRYHQLEPGLATTAAVQAQIVSEINDHNVRCLILRTEPARWLNRLRYPSGSLILDRFIKDTFVPAERFGEYRVWKRKTASHATTDTDENGS